MLLNKVQGTREIYMQSPTYIRELVELTGQQADGCTVAERHTFSSTNVARLREIPETLKELQRNSALFPSVYDYRLIPERGLLEVLTEHFTSVQVLIQSSRSRFSEKQGEQLLKEMIEAVKTMHGLYITHGCISAQSVAVASDGSFKLGGDLAKLARGGTDYVKDVKDLGTTCLQFFAVQLSPFETLSESQLRETVDRQLAAYSAPFSRMAKAVLCDMLKGEAAIDLHAFVSSWAIQSSQSSVAVSPQWSIPSLASHIPEVSLSIASTQRQESIPSQPSLPRTRPEIELAQHHFTVQFVSLETALAHRILDEGVMRRITGNLLDILNSYRGRIECILNIEWFQCNKCLKKMSVGERTALPICKHAFCKDCYNSTVIACLSNDDLSDIRCPIDSNPFKPLQSDELKVNLEVCVINKLDELILQKNACICPGPNCGRTYILKRQEPVNITCKICSKKFCSYCKKSPHRNFCDMWEKKGRPKINNLY